MDAFELFVFEELCAARSLHSLCTIESNTTQPTEHNSRPTPIQTCQLPDCICKWESMVDVQDSVFICQNAQQITPQTYQEKRKALSDARIITFRTLRKLNLIYTQKQIDLIAVCLHLRLNYKILTRHHGITVKQIEYYRLGRLLYGKRFIPNIAK
jgi:hypothetical protein